MLGSYDIFFYIICDVKDYQRDNNNLYTKNQNDLNTF